MNMHALKALARKLLGWLGAAWVLVGVCHCLDAYWGDGALPGFKAVRAIQKQAHITPVSTTDVTQALKATRGILQQTSPAVAEWVWDLQRRDRIIHHFQIPIDHPDYTVTLAFQSPMVHYLLLAPAFWQQSDIDKAAILVHEYRHSRQNVAKVLAVRGWQFLTLQAVFRPDANQLEDEAYQYQAHFYQAVGNVPFWLEYRLKEL